MEQIIKENKKWVDETWEKITVKLRRTSKTCRNKLPLYSVDGIYDDHSGGSASSWTNGFWPGIMWLMYAATGEEDFKTTAEIGEEILDKALENYNCLHHDVGFMWHISSGANYRLTGNEKSKNRNLHAAAALASRYNVDGGFIKAWNEKCFSGWAIIDCMMNIPLLYWAEKETNNVAFRKIAMHHADKTMENHIRPDGSVYHVMNYDVDTGEKGEIPFWNQGFDVEKSSWTRGQSWAIYGFILSYIHTGKQEYLDTAKKVAHYFIAAVSAFDYDTPSDFRAPKEPVLWDPSAGAITACGLIEIAKVVPEYEKEMYISAALKLLKSIEEKHCDWSEEEESIVQHTTGTYCEEKTHNHSYIFGDYYFVEALYKLKGNEILFW